MSENDRRSHKSHIVGILDGHGKTGSVYNAAADTCKMRETVRAISRILHMVNGDLSQGKS